MPHRETERHRRRRRPHQRGSDRGVRRHLPGVDDPRWRDNLLFAEYFQLYHPFLPFLDQLRSPEEYYSQDHKLLFWAIISVAARRSSSRPTLLKDLAKPLTDLIWDSVRNQPNHHVVKALCLLCTWPVPAERTVTDPTYMLCGVMMQIAMQIGLHQPTHPQDFSRTRVRLQQE